VRHLLSVLLWSVIAAAFLGPGTVTTAASAGAAHGLVLLWALVFSTVATLVLQEASARLAVVSGDDLARALRRRAAGGGRGGVGVRGALVLLLVVGAVVVGCAAYEAGNILGGVAGLALAAPLPAPVLTLAVGAVAVLLLLSGNPRTVARLLAATVAVMGVAFLATAARLAPAAGELVAGSLVPALPGGSALLVLGLVGTTVVPYNLFLGSGVAAGQSLPELRFGLTVAVGLGGLISMGVLVVGTAVDGPFSFEALAAVLAGRLGPWAADLFAAGLAAAGLSSAVTAPLAAAITAAGLFGDDERPERWAPRSWRFRAVWGGVLATGLAFGLAGVQPVPVILLAQAFNGVLLPWVAVFLLLAVNDRRLMGERGLNGPLSNTLMAVVVAVALLLGTRNVLRAAAGALGMEAPGEAALLAVTAVVAVALAVPVARGALAGRRAG
jgi:Mn2+/Fe2+ NRAMP family transporter